VLPVNAWCRFATYNVLGAVIWVALFVGGGFFFGAVPFVQKNFTLVVLAIVAISVVPVVLELMAAQREGKQQH
jgi:membrane-associated protein